MFALKVWIKKRASETPITNTEMSCRNFFSKMEAALMNEAALMKDSLHWWPTSSGCTVLCFKIWAGCLMLLERVWVSTVFWWKYRGCIHSKRASSENRNSSTEWSGNSLSFRKRGGGTTRAFNYFKKSIKVIKKNYMYVLKLVFMVSFHNLKFPCIFIDIHICDFSGNVSVWNGF